MKFRSNPSLIRGSIAPVVTPFASDGALDLAGLHRLIQWQLDSGSHGISVGGSTGEPSSQTTEERIEVIRAVAAQVDDRVPFVAGTGSTEMSETLAVTAAAAAAGADAALVIAPYYARPTQEGLYAWYAAVAGEFPNLPIIVYNVPSRTAVDVAPETVARLRRSHDNIVGVKETTKDFEHFSRVLRAAGTDTLVWSGIELLCLPLLALGGVGFVSAAANLAPSALATMYERWRSGDLDGARVLHYALHPIVDAIFVESNPAPAKWALAEAGLIGSGHVRPPLAALSDEGRRRVCDLLAQGSDVLSDPLTGLASGVPSPGGPRR